MIKLITMICNILFSTIGAMKLLGKIFTNVSMIETSFVISKVRSLVDITGKNFLKIFAKLRPITMAQAVVKK